MDQKKQLQIKQQLLKERKEFQEEVSHMNLGQLEGSMSDATGELSTYDNHPADLGSEMFERSKDLSIRENLKHQISHIDDALGHMKDGTYGVCEMCGKQIDNERLEAIPSTTLCKACKEKNEHDIIDTQVRPEEEEVIPPPFGGNLEGRPLKELGEQKINMYDGEDAWQDVARYGTADSPQDLPGTKDYQDMNIDADEDRSKVEDVDGIPYFRGADGMIYEDLYGKDDEDSPEEVIRGDEGWDRVQRKS
ncbi:MAG: TraR/DksA C4-type zinc finger protein [Bacillota bacterium]|nr:TraR/DksA C4-type zinc finger protein [Bacillota bacterium]